MELSQLDNYSIEGANSARVNRALYPSEHIKIDTEKPLETDCFYRRLGITGSLMATLTAGGKELHLVDGDDAFYVLDPRNHGRKKGYLEINQSGFYTIGRAYYSDIFDYPVTTSRNQFALSIPDSHTIGITNGMPTNPTFLDAYVLNNTSLPRESRIRGDQTENVIARVGDDSKFGEADQDAPYGYYMNYPIIGRNSPTVDGGVSLGGSPREAIVVDGRSNIMKQAYRRLIEEMRESFTDGDTLPTQTILVKVMEEVQARMPYDELSVDKISKPHYGDNPICLSTYILERAGVCRHQGLLAAYFIENLINDGYLGGKVNFERNRIRGIGGHAWAVYRENDTNQNETIIDVAQSYVGTREQAFEDGRWKYYFGDNKLSNA